MYIEIHQKDESVSWVELTELMHEAFQERLEQGLQFTCSFMTAEKLKEQLENSTVLVAVDSDSDALVGMAAIDIHDDEKGKWAYMSDLAVTPKYKRCGVMTHMFQELEDIAKINDCEYIESDTAVGAKSSVKWHKKNGFKIIELYSFKSTNYYSYIFRKDLTNQPQEGNPLREKLRFWKESLHYRMYNTKTGEKREAKWLDIYLMLRGAK